MTRVAWRSRNLPLSFEFTTAHPTRIFGCLTQSFQYGMNENLKSWNKRFSRQVFSLATQSRFRANARENMHRNCIESKHVRPFLPFLMGIRRAGLSSLAAVVLIMAASLSPATVNAQEYPWCLSREGYLYCFYKTQEQCQWTASGIGGCALNPRLLFPNKPRDSDQNLLSHMR